MIEALIWFLPWLTEAWLWENSVKIAIISTVLFSKPRNWCVDYDASGARMVGDSARKYSRSVRVSTRYDPHDAKGHCVPNKHGGRVGRVYRC